MFFCFVLFFFLLPLGVCWTVLWNTHFLKIQMKKKKNCLFQTHQGGKGWLVKSQSLKCLPKTPPPTFFFFFSFFLQIHQSAESEALWYQRQKPNDALHFSGFSFYSYIGKLVFSCLTLKKKLKLKLNGWPKVTLHLKNRGHFLIFFFTLFKYENVG